MQKRWIDEGEWTPVPDWIGFTVLAASCAIDFAIIGIAIWYCRTL